MKYNNALFICLSWAGDIPVALVFSSFMHFLHNYYVVKEYTRETVCNFEDQIFML